MSRRLLCIAQFVLLAAALLVTAGEQRTTSPGAADDQLSALPPEVRLRKLHLVRPDLIPYPIAYEVCC